MINDLITNSSSAASKTTDLMTAKGDASKPAATNSFQALLQSMNGEQTQSSAFGTFVEAEEMNVIKSKEQQEEPGEDVEEVKTISNQTEQSTEGESENLTLPNIDVTDESTSVDLPESGGEYGWKSVISEQNDATRGNTSHNTESELLEPQGNTEVGSKIAMQKTERLVNKNLINAEKTDNIEQLIDTQSIEKVQNERIISSDVVSASQRVHQENAEGSLVQEAKLSAIKANSQKGTSEQQIVQAAQSVNTESDLKDAQKSESADQKVVQELTESQKTPTAEAETQTKPNIVSTSENEIPNTQNATDSEEIPEFSEIEFVQESEKNIGNTVTVSDKQAPISASMLSENGNSGKENGIADRMPVSTEEAKRASSIFALRRNEFSQNGVAAVNTASQNQPIPTSNADFSFKSVPFTQEQSNSAHELAGKQFMHSAEKMSVTVDDIKLVQQSRTIEISSVTQKTERTSSRGEEMKEARVSLDSNYNRLEPTTQKEAPAGYLSQQSIGSTSYFEGDSITLSADQEAFLNEIMTDSQVFEEMPSNDDQNLGMLRLGDLSVANLAARKNVLGSFNRVFVQEQIAEKAQAKTWQKHSFELEEGKSIQLSTRNVDGVLQVKVASTNPELSKILQQFEQDIKSHLESELSLELDLQFENNGQETMQDFMEASAQRKNNTGVSKPTGTPGMGEMSHQKTIKSAVRQFGYNQMEWTV